MNYLAQGHVLSLFALNVCVSTFGLDGDMYEPSGAMSGSGSADMSKSKAQGTRARRTAAVASMLLVQRQEARGEPEKDAGPVLETRQL